MTALLTCRGRAGAITSKPMSPASAARSPRPSSRAANPIPTYLDRGGQRHATCCAASRRASCCLPRTRWTANSACCRRCTAPSVPVAQPLHLCRDESVIGSMFYLMSVRATAASSGTRRCPTWTRPQRGDIYLGIIDAHGRAAHRGSGRRWAWPTTASPATTSSASSSAGASSTAPAKRGRSRRWTR